MAAWTALWLQGHSITFGKGTISIPDRKSITLMMLTDPDYVAHGLTAFLCGDYDENSR
jgi:hypothetical protein